MPDWAIVGIIAVVVLFGASKLPEIARNLGRSSGEFKKGLKEGHEETNPSGVAPPASDVAPPPTASGSAPASAPEQDRSRPETTP